MLTTTVHEIADNIKDRFGIDPDIYVLIKRVSDVMRHTSTGAMVTKREKFVVDNYQVKMPCNVVWIRSVSSVFNYINNQQDGITLPDSPFINDDVIQVSEYSEIKRNYVRQPKGPWVDYRWQSPYLLFNETGSEVWVEYIVTAVDEEGFPIIPKTIEEACEYEYMYFHYLPQFMAGKLNINVYNEIKELRRRKLAQAINKHGLSRNELSIIFDNLSTFDRKSYNVDI